MKVLTTFPGKFGDLLWALPTVRAISEVVGEPVDLVIAGEFGSIVPLLQRQSYLGNVLAANDWLVENTAPMTPREPPMHPSTLLVDADFDKYDQIFHLGYQGWPEGDLARATVRCAAAQGAFTTAGGELLRVADLGMFDLNRPWIEAPYSLSGFPYPAPYAVGFTDEHFELKFGVSKLLEYRRAPSGSALNQYLPVNLSNSPRWNTETWLGGVDPAPYRWEAAAAWLGVTPVFLGCNSALHVLARAMGVPVVMMEPNPHRWNDIFYPFGKSGNGVELVCGNDGPPTFDARHVWESLQRVLSDHQVALSSRSSDKPGVGSGDMINSSNSAPNPMATSGSNVPAAATAPLDGLSLFPPEEQERER